MGDITREFRDNVTCGIDEGGDREHGIDLVLTIPMRPRGKQRPRATRSSGRMYTPEQTRTFERDFAAHAKRQMPDEPLDGLLRIDVVAFVARPKRLQRKRDPDGPIYSGVAPDQDNILKSCQDSLEGFMTGSDAVVARGQCVKFYSEKGGIPRLLVRIRSLVAGTDERQVIQRIMFGHV